MNQSFIKQTLVIGYAITIIFIILSIFHSSGWLLGIYFVYSMHLVILSFDHGQFESQFIINNFNEVHGKVIRFGIISLVTGPAAWIGIVIATREPTTVFNLLPAISTESPIYNYIPTVYLQMSSFTIVLCLFSSVSRKLAFKILRTTDKYFYRMIE
jgi:hypothetical protein